MFAFIKWLVVRLALVRWLFKGLGGLAFLVPLAFLLKFVGLPVLMVLGVLALPVLFMLLIFGLPLFLVLGFGAVVLFGLGMLLSFGLVALKIFVTVVLPIWLVWQLVKWVWSMLKGRGDGDSPVKDGPPPAADDATPGTAGA